MPFIFVSGMLGEEVAIETLKRGATDYVLKQRLERLPAAVRRALAEAASGPSAGGPRRSRPSWSPSCRTVSRTRSPP